MACWRGLTLTLFFMHTCRRFLPVSMGSGLGNILQSFCCGFTSRLEREGTLAVGGLVGLGAQWDSATTLPGKHSQAFRVDPLCVRD